MIGNRLFQKAFALCTSLLLCSAAILGFSVPAFAETDYAAEQEARKLLPIQSNEIMGWPEGPAVGAEGAILVEANTGTILYAKNIHEKLYPASTTKILSALIDIENSNLDDTVEFSTEAVYSIEPGSSNMGMDAGQSITMEQCLYGILVHSANEVANAAAEHVAGSMGAFVDMMNQKAAELGCTESHFVTINGLHDENHYTTPYDLSLIAKAFFSNETLCKISNTPTYLIEPTATQPDEIPCYTHNAMVRGEYPYDYLVGSKTGFTSIARQTLVSCAQKDGMKLICVVMKEESPNQFLDTITLFDYGFQNFHMLNIAENETRYTVNSSDFIDTDNDIFGSSNPIISIDSKAGIVIPNTAEFSDAVSTLSYDSQNDASIATINYFYGEVPIGRANVNLELSEVSSYDFDGPVITDSDKETDAKENVIFVNVLKIVIAAGILVVFLITVIFLRSFFKNYHFGIRRRKFQKKESQLDFRSLNKRERRRRRTPKYKRRDSYKDIEF